MEFRAADIAQLVQGKVDGNEEALITGVSKIDDSRPDTLAFLANTNYTKYIYSTQASVVLVNDDFKADSELDCTLIRVPDAYKAIAVLLNYYDQMKPQKVGVEDPSFISKSAKYGENCYIGAFAYLGDNVTIGDNVKIYPQAYIGDNVTIEEGSIIYSGVKVYADCKIGKDCIIHSGAVIGSDGFGHAPQEDGTYMKIAQVGNVVIGDLVEVGANTTIDCATMGSTVIESGVRLDNLVQIAHNVKVGANTVMAAQVGIAGSTSIGENCIFGGQAGTAGHIKIGDRVQVAGQSGLSGDVKDDQKLFGSPAFDAKEAFLSSAVYKRLPQLRKDLMALSKQVKALEAK